MLEVDSLSQTRISSQGSLGHHLEFYNGTDTASTVRNNSPTVMKDNNNPKGLRRCASNLSAAREFASLVSEDESCDGTSSSENTRNIVDDVQTRLIPNQERKDVISTHIEISESVLGGDAPTVDSLPARQGDSSNFRRLFPASTRVHKVILDSSHNQLAIIPNNRSMSTMMMQRPLYYEYTHHNNALALHTTPSRPRSKNIMIKGSRCYDESSHQSSAEQMYDWATWKMYHRITSARRSRASVVPIPNSSSAPSTMSFGDDQRLNFVPEDSESASQSSIDYTLDGAIFEIDDI